MNAHLFYEFGNRADYIVKTSEVKIFFSIKTIGHNYYDVGYTFKLNINSGLPNGVLESYFSNTKQKYYEISNIENLSVTNVAGGTIFKNSILLKTYGKKVGGTIVEGFTGNENLVITSSEVVNNKNFEVIDEFPANDYIVKDSDTYVSVGNLDFSGSENKVIHKRFNPKYKNYSEMAEYFFNYESNLNISQLSDIGEFRLGYHINTTSLFKN